MLVSCEDTMRIDTDLSCMYVHAVPHLKEVDIREVLQVHFHPLEGFIYLSTRICHLCNKCATLGGAGVQTMLATEAL